MDFFAVISIVLTPSERRRLTDTAHFVLPHSGEKDLEIWYPIKMPTVGSIAALLRSCVSKFSLLSARRSSYANILNAGITVFQDFVHYKITLVFPPLFKSISMLRLFFFQAPLVKSGTLIEFELFLTDQSVNGTIELHAAASYTS